MALFLRTLIPDDLVLHIQEFIYSEKRQEIMEYAIFVLRLHYPPFSCMKYVKFSPWDLPLWMVVDIVKKVFKRCPMEDYNSEYTELKGCIRGYLDWKINTDGYDKFYDNYRFEHYATLRLYIEHILEK